MGTQECEFWGKIFPPTVHRPFCLMGEVCRIKLLFLRIGPSQASCLFFSLACFLVVVRLHWKAIRRKKDTQQQAMLLFPSKYLPNPFSLWSSGALFCHSKKAVTHTGLGQKQHSPWFDNFITSDPLFFFRKHMAGRVSGKSVCLIFRGGW